MWVEVLGRPRNVIYTRDVRVHTECMHVKVLVDLQWHGTKRPLFCEKF